MEENRYMQRKLNIIGSKSMLPLRGGSYLNYSGSAGVFALMLHFARSFTVPDVGFRSALPSRQIPKPYGAAVSTRG